MNAKAGGISTGIFSGPRQPEVVHSANPGERIAQAGLNTRAEDRGEQSIGIISFNTFHSPWMMLTRRGLVGV